MISGRFILAALIFLAANGTAAAQNAPRYRITTIAGNGAHDFAGDGGAAIKASLNYPQGIALDAEGNLYIADCLNHRIRRVAPDGGIRTVAGSGAAGYSGDNGAATSAALSLPCGIAADGPGNLYIADTGNDVIRRVATNGTITTIAGNHTSGFAGDGAAATSANLNTPLGLDRDAAGNLYFADVANNRIRRVGTDGNITTVAGAGIAGSWGDGVDALTAYLNGPQDVAVDAAGNLFIADTSNHRIRKVTPEGTIVTVAGGSTRGFAGDGGPATEALLNYPKALALDSNGNLFVADTLNSRVRMITAAGIIYTVAGNGRFGSRGDGGPAAEAELRFPSGVAVDSAGRVYVADDQNSRIRLLLPQPDSVEPEAIPTILPGGVVSSTAFGGSRRIAPGTWIEIHGVNLAREERSWDQADFAGGRAPESLAGTRVWIGGLPAYLAYVSPERVYAQAPMGVGLGPQPVTVSTDAGTSAPVEATVDPVEPGLLAPADRRIAGRQYVSATLADGATPVLPSATLGAANGRPARPGEVIVLHGIGFGAVSPWVDAGESAGGSSALAAPVAVYFGARRAEVLYAGLAPGSVGVYQFNVVVPEVEEGDAVPLSFTLGGVEGGQTLYTAVRR